MWNFEIIRTAYPRPLLDWLAIKFYSTSTLKHLPTVVLLLAMWLWLRKPGIYHKMKFFSTVCYSQSMILCTFCEDLFNMISVCTFVALQVIAILGKHSH